MLTFCSDTHERHFRVQFDKEHVRSDLLLHSISMAYYLYAIPQVLLSHGSVGRLDFRARAIFVVVCLLEKALALGMCLGRPDLYRRHRTLIASTSHALGVVISDVYYSLWAADADLSDPRTFRMVALWAGGNYIAPAYWGLMTVTASSWLYLQLLHEAVLLLRLGVLLSLSQPYLYHMTGFTQAVNARLGYLVPHTDAITETGLLLGIWVALQLVLGLLVPSCIMYKTQLLARRLWREEVLNRRRRQISSAGGGPADDRPPRLAGRDKGLCIRPTWQGFAPQAAALLLLSFVAGLDMDVMRFMV